MIQFRKLLTAAALSASLLLPGLANAQILAGQNEPNFVNLLDNGNFNIAQRGTTAVTGVTTTPTYLQDRWALAAGTSTSSGISNVTTSLPTGFTNGVQIQRTAAQTGVVPVCLAQEVPSSEVLPIAGQPVTLSFWMSAGANLSSAAGAVVAQVTTGTSTDEGLATWLTGLTGAASAVSTANATVTPTTTMQRFSVTGTIPTGAKEAVVNICFTPVGTAGTTDGIVVTGVQLQRGTVASNFEWRPAGIELSKAQRYYYQWTETASTTNSSPFVCSAQSTTVAVCTAATHTAMRVAPTVACTFGTIKRQVAGTDTALTACAAAATTNGISQTDAVAITATVASGDTAGLSGVLMSGNSTGGGKITASADF